MKNNKTYPDFICFDCGKKYGKREVNKTCTVNLMTCAICNVHGPVTEPRDFGHLKDWTGNDFKTKVCA